MTWLLVVCAWVGGMCLGHLIACRDQDSRPPEPPERFVVKQVSPYTWQVIDTKTMAVYSDAHWKWESAWNLARTLNRKVVENSDGE